MYESEENISYFTFRETLFTSDSTRNALKMWKEDIKMQIEIRATIEEEEVIIQIFFIIFYKM